jgi:hypothetical protein
MRCREISCDGLNIRKAEKSSNEGDIVSVLFATSTRVADETESFVEDEYNGGMLLMPKWTICETHHDDVEVASSRPCVFGNVSFDAVEYHVFSCACAGVRTGQFGESVIGSIDLFAHRVS